LVGDLGIRGKYAIFDAGLCGKIRPQKAENPGIGFSSRTIEESSACVNLPRRQIRSSCSPSPSHVVSRSSAFSTVNSERTTICNVRLKSGYFTIRILFCAAYCPDDQLSKQPWLLVVTSLIPNLLEGFRGKPSRLPPRSGKKWYYVYFNSLGHLSVVAYS
jgi:hypothetical protein